MSASPHAPSPGGATAAVVADASPAVHHPVAHGIDGLKLALGALGVVYGDIGTSPLYAIKECVTLPHGVAPRRRQHPRRPVAGVLVADAGRLGQVPAFVMRADNDGEGGVLALHGAGRAPAPPQRRPRDVSTAGARADQSGLLIMLGLFGAALLYGDGVITPAISVLSAVEGLEVATTAFSPFVVPITCVILVALFAVQKRGTGGIGAVFGPLTLCLVRRDRGARAALDLARTRRSCAP